MRLRDAIILADRERELEYARDPMVFEAANQADYGEITLAKHVFEEQAAETMKICMRSGAALPDILVVHAVTAFRFGMRVQRLMDARRTE